MKNKKLIKQLDNICDTLDDLLLAGQFKEVDQWLKEYSIEGQEPAVLLTILTITLAASTNLTAREEFYDRAKAELLRAGVHNVDTLLLGLQ